MCNATVQTVYCVELCNATVEQFIVLSCVMQQYKQFIVLSCVMEQYEPHTMNVSGHKDIYFLNSTQNLQLTFFLHLRVISLTECKIGTIHKLPLLVNTTVQHKNITTTSDNNSIQRGTL